MNTNVLDYGAVSDSSALNTSAFQAAIDECAAGGGGRVTVPAGVYKSGTLWLKSGVELHLEMGAVLLASENMDDYNELDAFEQNQSCAVEGWVGKHLIIALECTDCAITGLGTINGNCTAFVDEFHDYPQYRNGYIWSDGMSELKDKERTRPGQLICFIECSHVRVIDVTVRNSPCWSCYFLGCEYVTVRGLRVFNPRWMLNSDGIDIDASRNVTVSDCIIETGDDAITLRASEQRLRAKKIHCENVTITNCVLSTQICAFRIGVGTGLIRGLRVSNIVARDCCNLIQLCTAYSAKGRADLEDLNFSGISATGVGRVLEAFAKNGAYIRNVTVENVRTDSCMQSYIDGSDGRAEDITLRNIDVTLYDKYAEMTPALMRERGEWALLLKDAFRIGFDNVSIYGTLCDSLGTASAENCHGVGIKDCSFSL